jgi:hypothetical protein
MTKNSHKSTTELERISEMVVDDIMHAPDEEIIAEAKAQLDDVGRACNEVINVIDRAVLTGNKAKLINARANLNSRGNSSESKILQFTLQRKKQILNQFSSSDAQLKQKITMAARNGDGASENDINGIIDDLLELGLIDDEGNLK